MKSFSFDHLGFRLDGQDAFLISGEFHYFRVPRDDWKRRMQLFREAGGNCLATYVPWLIHEPSEGDIRFGGEPFRDLRGFLTLADEMGLKVLLRPGPYQYSELKNAGLPDWLLDDYPELRAVRLDGSPISNSPRRRGYSVSYLHPVFLQKARAYYRAFADVVRPFLMENGGPVCMLQVDNELAGIHVWYGSLDYNPEAMGFYRADGRWPRWLEAKYGSIEALNAAYGTRFLRFAYVMPIEHANPASACECLRVKDYDAFYRDMMAEYLAVLTGWLREDGLGGQVCHNAANPGMNGLFVPTVERLKDEPFLLGSDHYYTLDQNWKQNNPTPQYALYTLRSCDTLRAMGMPPTVLELPGGSPSDTPPILGNDLLACHMANLALGMKGLNYYIFTGGPNVPGTGTTCDTYDYCASVRADGTLNEECYHSLQTFGRFMQQHAWLQRASRVASVQIGYEWSTHAGSDAAFAAEDANEAFIEKGLLYTLMCSHFSPELVLIGDGLDVNRPLIVPGSLSENGWQTVKSFLERGGQVLMLPDGIPVAGAEYAPAMGVRSPVVVDGTHRVYGTEILSICTALPEGARVLAADESGEAVLGYDMPFGRGRLLWLGIRWQMSVWPQAEMLEHLMRLLGAQKCIESSNRSIFTTLWQDENGRRMAFAMNLFSSPQKTKLTVHAAGGRDLGEIALNAMEVRPIEL